MLIPVAFTQKVYTSTLEFKTNVYPYFYWTPFSFTNTITDPDGVDPAYTPQLGYKFIFEIKNLVDTSLFGSFIFYSVMLFETIYSFMVIKISIFVCWTNISIHVLNYTGGSRLGSAGPRVWILLFWHAFLWKRTLAPPPQGLALPLR